MLQQLMQDKQQLEQGPPQQQQQQRHNQSSSSQQGQGRDAKAAVQVVLDVAAKQVSMYQYLNSIWPASSNSRSSLSSSTELAAAALPSVQLAMLVMKACEGRSPYVIAVLAATMLLSKSLQEELQAMHLTQLSSAAEHTAGVTGTGSSNSARSLNPVVHQLLQSDQLLLLLVAAQAMYAKTLQDSRGSCQQGSGRTSSVAMAAAAAAAAAAAGEGAATAEALLRAVGLDWTCSAASLFSGWDQADITKCITDSLSDMLYVLTHMLEFSEQPPILLLLLHLPVTFLQPWALLQLQCVQLLDSCQSKYHCSRILMALLTAAGDLDAAEQAALKRSLLQPLLLLWPHIPQLPASGSSSSSGAALQPNAAVAGSKHLQVAFAGVLLKMLFAGE
jgi:hypothetical protein